MIYNLISLWFDWTFPLRLEPDANIFWRKHSNGLLKGIVTRNFVVKKFVYQTAPPGPIIDVLVKNFIDFSWSYSSLKMTPCCLQVATHQGVSTPRCFDTAESWLHNVGSNGERRAANFQVLENFMVRCWKHWGVGFTWCCKHWWKHRGVKAPGVGSTKDSHFVTIKKSEVLLTPWSQVSLVLLTPWSQDSLVLLTPWSQDSLVLMTPRSLLFQAFHTALGYIFNKKTVQME